MVIELESGLKVSKSKALGCDSDCIGHEFGTFKNVFNGLLGCS